MRTCSNISCRSLDLQQKSPYFKGSIFTFNRLNMLRLLEKLYWYWSVALCWTAVVLERALMRATSLATMAAHLSHCQPSSIHLIHCWRTTTSNRRCTASTTPDVLKVGLCCKPAIFILCLVPPEAVNRCLDPMRRGGGILVNLVCNFPYSVN
jgi:hypothetical protein